VRGRRSSRKSICSILHNGCPWGASAPSFDESAATSYDNIWWRCISLHGGECAAHDTDRCMSFVGHISDGCRDLHSFFVRYASRCLYVRRVSIEREHVHRAIVDVFNNQVAIPPLAICRPTSCLWLEVGCSKRGSAKQAAPHVLPANERVTDGTRTRDLRSHSPSNAYYRQCITKLEIMRLQQFREQQSIRRVQSYTI
jgi:hypothetical protein